jgi:hypothetical protein
MMYDCQSTSWRKIKWLFYDPRLGKRTAANMSKQDTPTFLPLMPFDPAWVEQGAAFVHPDPRMAKAAMKLLFAAWRGSPVGSIPSSHSFITEATGLPLEVVAEGYVLLTEGYELRADTRLHHAALANVCERLTDAYGKEIEGFAMAVAMAAQDPDQFSLMNVEAGTKKPRGRTMLPKGFGYDAHPGLRPWAAENGYPAPNQQDYIMEKFIDYASGRGEKYKDWPATFRDYARNEISRFNRRPPPPQWANDSPVQPQSNGHANAGKPSPFAGLSRGRGPLSRGEMAAEHNATMLDQAEQMLARSAQAPRQRSC